MRKLTALVVVLLSVTAQLIVFAAPTEQGPATLEKIVSRSYSFLPNGTLVDARTYVMLSVEGDEPLDLIDTTVLVDPSTLRVYEDLEASITPEGSYVSVAWKGVASDGGKLLRYVAKPLLVPIIPKVEVLVDGSDAELSCNGGVCKVLGDVGSKATYRLHLKNEFVVNGTKLPLTVAVSAVVDSDLLEVVSAYPEPTVTVMGNLLVLTWGFILKEESEITLEFRVKGLNEWYEAPLPSIRVSASLNPSKTLASLRELEERLESTLNALEVVERLANSSKAGLSEVTATLKGITMSLQDYDEKLANATDYAYEASAALMNASEAAKEASERMSMIAGRLESVSKIKNNVEAYRDSLGDLAEVLGNASQVLESLEELGLAGQLPGVKEKLSKAESKLRTIMKIVSKIEKISEEASDSAETLELLSDLLREASMRTKDLGDALSEARGKLVELKAEIERYILTIEERADVIQSGLEDLLLVKGDLVRELSEVRYWRRSAERLALLYSMETPKMVVGDRVVNGSLLSDELTITISSVRVVKRSAERATIALHGDNGGEPRVPYVLILLSSAALLSLLMFCLVTPKERAGYETLYSKIDAIESELTVLRSALEGDAPQGAVSPLSSRGF